MGSKDKYWVRLPNDDRRWLVKLARTDERDGTVSGEDWAEWLVQYFATMLGLPTASVRPAIFDGRRAIVSRSMLRDSSDSLAHGNEILGGHFPEYDPSIRGENSGYSVPKVREALTSTLPPFDRPDLSQFSGFGVWAGYLLLDAWVSGRDRHHENWGVILRGTEKRLAPSFDHGNALGFQERDSRRERMLGDSAHLERWLERGTSQHFIGKPGLIALAHEALQRAEPEAANHWYSQLRQVDAQTVENTVNAVPDTVMSETSRRFVIQLLDANRRRMLDGY